MALVDGEACGWAIVDVWLEIVTLCSGVGITVNSSEDELPTPLILELVLVNEGVAILPVIVAIIFGSSEV